MVAPGMAAILIFYLYLVVLYYFPVPSHFTQRKQNCVFEMSTFHIHRDGETRQVWSRSWIVTVTGLPWYKRENRPILSITLPCPAGKLILRQPTNLTLGSEITIGGGIVLGLDICIVVVHHI